MVAIYQSSLGTGVSITENIEQKRKELERCSRIAVRAVLNNNWYRCGAGAAGTAVAVHRAVAVRTPQHRAVAVRTSVERFGRRGTEPNELFRSELGQNSFKIQEFSLKKSKKIQNFGKINFI